MFQDCKLPKDAMEFVQACLSKFITHITMVILCVCVCARERDCAKIAQRKDTFWFLHASYQCVCGPIAVVLLVLTCSFSPTERIGKV